MISASIPLSMTFSAVLLGVTKSGDIVQNPSAAVAKTTVSLHALAISSKNHLLLTESHGRFDFDTWELVRERAQSICQGSAASDGDVAMSEGANTSSVNAFIRETVEDQIYSDHAHKLDSI
jgi:exosome complex component RRP46